MVAHHDLGVRDVAQEERHRHDAQALARLQVRRPTRRVLVRQGICKKVKKIGSGVPRFIPT